MRKFVLFFICVAVVSSCHEPKDQAPLNSSSVFRKEIGEKIPLDVAERWVSRYNSENRSGKITSHPQVPASVLRDFLYPLSDKIGVVFQHGIDVDGEHHILIIASKENTPLWNSVVLDAKTGSFISGEVARAWAEEYKAQDLSGPWSFFFGRNVFETIIQNSRFSFIELAHGLNDDYQEQIVLYAWYEAEGSVDGRASSMEMQVEAFDKSNPCPPVCHEDN